MTLNRRWIAAGMIALSMGLFAGCVVVDRDVRGPVPCPRAVWIAGHYGERGVWHNGHWRCD